jgi:drug/metabolite transporter (DMT)-like permease
MGFLLVTASAAAWSLAGFFTRIIPLDSWTILVWRGIFGGLSIVAIMLCCSRGNRVGAFRAMGLPGWLAAASSTLGMVSFIPALKLTSVADVAIIYATVPFVAGTLAWVWLRETLTPRTLAASALAFLGVLITLAGSSWEGGLTGDLLALVMTLAMALTMVTLRRYRDVPSLPVACVSNILTALVSLPFAAMSSVDAMSLAWLALFGFVQTALGLTLFTIGSRLIPAAETALIGVLDTPLAPLWVWIAFSEAPSLNALIGGAIVMAAVIGHALLGRRHLSAAATEPR